jgi:CelD/BcsL family acetyltransferase involved in cellulose biosynthesis
MLLLLCVRRHHGVTVIHFPDCGVSDYNAPLFAADFQPTDEEFAVLWKDIARVLPKADLINFEKMPETVANRPNPMARFVGAQRMRLSAWGFSLPKRRADYDQLLKSVVRKELRRKRRNLEVEGQIRYVRPQSAAQGREFFETLCRQRAARYRELGRPDILGDPLFLRFYEAVIFDNWATQYGALSALMVGEEIAATLFALSHRDRYLLLMHCFETGRWGLKSPGIVAVDSAITDQIESGTGYFDLTVGNESYKLQFGVKENFLYSYEQTISPLGWAYMAVRNAKRFASEQVRKLPRKYLPENLR